MSSSATSRTMTERRSSPLSDRYMHHRCIVGFHMTSGAHVLPRRSGFVGLAGHCSQIAPSSASGLRVRLFVRGLQCTRSSLWARDRQRECERPVLRREDRRRILEQRRRGLSGATRWLVVPHALLRLARAHRRLPGPRVPRTFSARPLCRHAWKPGDCAR